MPETTVQLPLRRVARRWLRSAGAAFAAFLLVTCSSDSPVGPGRRGIGSLRLAPVFDVYARVAPLTLDGVRVIVVRPPAETLAVVPRPFNPNSSQLQLNIPVFLQSVSEDLLVTLELYAGQTLLFTGTRTLRVSQGAATAPDSIPVAYQGPGSQVAALVITPRDTTVSFGALLPYVVSATDGQAAPVAQYYVSWSTPGAPAGTTIDATGRLTAPSVRDTFYVKAVTPNGVIDSTSVIVAAAPATLVKSGGDNQTAQIGARLAQLLAVQVNGNDGLPVTGVQVGFAVTTGGGTVDSVTATTDAQGIARTGVVLGNSVGAQTFTASATGLTPVVFTATATGSAGVVTWTGATSSAWTTASNWSPAVVPGATDSVVIPVFQPNAPALSGNASVAALALLNANTSLSLAGNLTVTRGISLPDTNSNISVSSGQITAGNVRLGGFQAFIDATGGGISVSGAATITGDRAFIDGTGPGSNSFGPITLSGSQAFLTQRGGSAGAISISGPSAFWQAEGTIAVTGSPALQLTGNTSFVTTSMTVPSNVTFNGDVLIGGTAGFFSQGNGGSRVTINGNLATSGSGTLQQTFAGDTMIVSGSASFGGGDESALLTNGALFVSGNFSQTGPGTSFIGSGNHAVFLNGSGAQTINFAAPGFGAGRFQNVVIANSAGGVTATSDLYATGTAGVTPTAVRTLSGNGSTLFTTILNVSNFTFNNLLLNFAGSTVVTFDTVTFQGYAPTATPLTISHPGAATPLPFQDISFTVTPTSGFYIDATDSNPGDGVPLVIDMLNPTPATDGGFVQLAGGATINWPPAPPVKTWTGTISTDWSIAGNWSPVGVPGALDDVSIVPATNQPTLSANSVARKLTIAGAGARVTVAGHSLTIGGNLVTHTDGLLVMTNAADLVIVLGDAAFQGGDETGLLSAGELRVAGDFDQQDQTNTHSFLASGTHRTVMNGAALQGVRFCCTAGASGFQELDISSTVGINIQFSNNGVFVFDTLISQVGAGTAPWLYMLGSPLRAARLRVDKLLVDRGTLTLNEGGVAANQQFDNVTFQNYLTSQTQFAIVAPGGGPRTLTFSNLTFQPLNTGDTGRYLNVTAPSGTLIVDLPGASPAGGNGPAFTTTTGAVTVNWPAVGPIQWTGATSTDWNTATNWSTGAVPTNADDVVIPSGGNQPSVTTSCSAKSLTVNVGATLNLNAINCQVGGDVFADGSITGSGALQLAATSQLRGNIPNLIASGAVTVVGRTVLAGSATISNGSLSLGGHTVTIAGSLTTQGTGTIGMTNALDSVIVAGAGSFGGGDESASLTAGYLKLGGSFGQSSANSAASFAASGTHRTEIGAGGVRVINFASPGSGAGTSHFNDLIVSGATGGINIAANTFVNGQLISHPTGATPVIGIVAAVKVLTVGGVDVSRLGIDQNVMAIGAGVITQFDTVSFTGQANGVTQLSINNAGTAAALTFNALSFGVAPTTGHYIVANDLDGASPNALTINVNGASPAAPSPSLFSFTNGALINWPGVAPAKTWTGAQNSDWNTINNWSPLGIPTTSDDVVIPLVANQPSLSANGAARNLTVASGVVVLVNGFTINITGDLVSNAANPFSGGGTLQLSGTVKSVSGALGVGITLNVTDSYQLAGRTTAGSLLLNGNGNLIVNGQTIAVVGTLNTSGNGVLTMTNVADSVIVGASANFSGGSETGLLSAGVLSVGNSLTQSSGSAAAFDASGTHRTVLAGASPLVSILSSGSTTGSSHFQELTWAGGGTLSLTTLTYVEGQLTVGSAGTINGGGFTNAIHVGNLVNTGLLTLFNAQLWIETTAPVPVALSNLTFTVGTSIVPLFVRHPGLPAAGALTLDQVTFTNTPVSPAVFLDVDDANTSDGNLVTVNVTNTTPASPGSQVNVANGAVINWPFNANLHTWTGAVDNSWENPLNWTGGGGPGITGDAVIPVGPPIPVVGSNHQIGSLTVLTGATLNLNGHVLTVNGTVDASGQVTSGVGGGFLATSAGPIRGNFANISVEIGLGGTPAALNGGVLLAGTGTVFISGDVTLGGNVLLANQAVLKTTNGVGRLIMTNVGDVVTADSTDWSGGNETGLLTAGSINTRAFSQGLGGTSDPASFVASGSHLVLLGGTAPATVSFADPATSHFQNVEFAGGSSAITLATNVTAAGQLRAQTSGVDGPTLTGAGVTLTAGGADVGANAGFTALTLSGVPLVLTGGVINNFGHLAFINQSPVGTALTVNNAGQAAAYTFNNLVFTTTLTAGGFHLAANDLDGATPDAFTIDMVGATPAVGGGSFQATNGAVVHWPPAAPVTTWTGAVNSDWSVPGNWSSGAVPTATDDVVIPVATPAVSVTGACTAKSLLMNGTMDLGTNNCQVQGDVIANGFINSTGGVIQMQAVGQVRGNLPGLEVSAPVTLVGTTGLGGGSGNLVVTGAGTTLTLNGNTLASPGSLTVQNGAVIVMNRPEDLLSFTGTVIFDGGDETGLLTAGLLTFAGNFSQGASTSPASFFASGNHVTKIGGLGNVGVSFATPGSSRFQELDLSPMGNNAFTIGTDVTVAGQLHLIATAAGPTVNDLGSSTLTAGGADIGATGNFTALTMDGVPLVLSGGAITAFDHISFTNQSPVGTALTVNNVGQGSPYTFTSLNFTTFLTAGGFHIQANDLDGASPDALTIDVIGANPATGGGFFQANNGAVIHWPPAGNVITWTGAVNQDWNNAGNWSPAQVPGVIDNVVLVPITNQPVLTSNVGINDLTSTAGSILDVGSFVLVTGGNVDLAGSITGTAGSGVSLTGTGKTLRGTINTLVAVVGSYVLNGNFVMTGDLSVNGSLDLASFNATVNGNFLTNGSGVLVMTTSGGFLDIASDAIFAGGNTNGLLTQGTIRIGGDFNQIGTTSAQSFAASPGHLTEFSNNPVNFLFQTPGATQSHFGDLAETGFGAQFVLQTDMTILGYLNGGDGFGGSFLGNSCPNTLTVSQWNNSVLLDCVQLVIDDPTGNSGGMSGVTFQNLPTNVTQLTIRHPGVAAGSWQTFGNLNFVPLSGGDTGHYIDANDLDASAPFLAIDVTNSNTLNGPTFTTTSGGASVLWPNATITWTGAVDNNWFLPGNWDLGFFPRITNNVIIPAGPANQPSLIGNVTVASLSIGGSLVLNGNSVSVSGDFATTGNGTIAMNSAFSVLGIGGNATFAGGSTAGLLTAGQLIVSGNFLQTAGTSTTSFAPSGTHLTSFSGTSAITIDIESPGSGSGGSHFQNLDLTSATGGVSLALNTLVDSVFSSADPAAKLIGNGASLTMRYAQVSGLTVDNAPLIVDEQNVARAQNLSNITFQGFANTGTTMLKFSGAGGTVAARPTITTDNLVFQTLPIGAGNFYLDATVTSGIFMTFNFNGSNQGTTAGGNGATLTRTTGGTVTVNWP